MSKVVSAILPAAAGFLIGGPLGSAIGADIGVTGAAGLDIASTLGGAAVGAGTSALMGNSPLSGALGGAGGGFGATLGGPGGLLSSIGNGGAAGATSILNTSDPIEALSNAMTATGTNTATDAAQALGFSSTNAMLQAANPAWLSTGAAIQGAQANATGGLLGGANAPQSGSFTGTLGSGGSATNSAAARALSQLGMTGASGGGGAGLGTVSSLMSLGSGIYGLSNAMQEQQLAKSLEGANQNTGQYASQLQSLMNNPSSITSMPGYQAGLEGVERSMAAQGYQGSGNMAAALQQYSGNFFNNQVSQLQSLANPAGGATALQGATAANTASSQALAALGYGAAGLGL